MDIYITLKLGVYILFDKNLRIKSNKINTFHKTNLALFGKYRFMETRV